jgi:hypothetical protein
VLDRIEVATLTERKAHIGVIGDLKRQGEVLQGKLAALVKPKRVSKKTRG